MQWLMLQQEQPEDFVIASGAQHSVREFIRWSAAELGLELRFEGQGLGEVAVVAGVEGNKAPAVRPGQVVVRIDPRYFRPSEVDTLLGNAEKARIKLGWQPTISARQMCAEMIEADLEVASRHAFLKAQGHDVPMTYED
jgi:GDPmannose 4,6-dehydratase